MNQSLKTFIFLLTLLPTSSVFALPIQLTEEDFQLQISTLTTVTEDFETLATGLRSSPFTFANGTYNASDDAGIANESLFCNNNNDQCLTNREITGVKTFNNLLTGTIYWGVYMAFRDYADPFNVKVNGGSGTLSINFIANKSSYFLGFSDVLGINSIEIENLGQGGHFGNFSFDDITVASAPTNVPEGSSALYFLMLCLFGLAIRRQRPQ